MSRDVFLGTCIRSIIHTQAHTHRYRSSCKYRAGEKTRHVSYSSSATPTKEPRADERTAIFALPTRYWAEWNRQTAVAECFTRTRHVYMIVKRRHKRRHKQTTRQEFRTIDIDMILCCTCSSGAKNKPKCWKISRILCFKMSRTRKHSTRPNVGPSNKHSGDKSSIRTRLLTGPAGPRLIG